MAELLLAQDAIERRQAAAAQLGRHVERVQTQRLRLRVNRARGLDRQRTVGFHRTFERPQLVGDETADAVDQHALFVAEGEIHVVS